MGRLTLPFAFLVWDLLTSDIQARYLRGERDDDAEEQADEKVPPIQPWCFPEVQAWFYLGQAEKNHNEKIGDDPKNAKLLIEIPDFSDSIPHEGVMKLDRTCRDFKRTFPSESDYVHWIDFCRWLKKKIPGHETRQDLIADFTKTTKSGDKYSKPKAHTVAWFKELWKRAEGNERIDKILARQELLPHQVYKQFKKRFPPVVKKGQKVRLIFIISFPLPLTSLSLITGDDYESHGIWCDVCDYLGVFRKGRRTPSAIDLGRALHDQHSVGALDSERPIRIRKQGQDVGGAPRVLGDPRASQGRG